MNHIKITVNQIFWVFTLKYITVPLNTQAAIDLDYDQAKPEDLLEICINEEYFELLNNELFMPINEICNVLIDNHEDECVSGIEKLELVLDIIIAKESERKNDAIPQLGEIKILVSEAIKRDTGIYFFF